MDWSQHLPQNAIAEPLALDGGRPVRSSLLPYARQSVDATDIAAVAAVLQSDWLTTGPKVAEFERSFAAAVGSQEAVAVSSGTAALHAAIHALAIGPGDEVIVPALTFAATANCVAYLGGRPVFADVDAATLLLDPNSVEQLITPRTRAILAVDYAGQPCDYAALGEIARRHGLALVSDACHSLGGAYRGQSVGSLADLSTFSLHPAKVITAGEGGIITTNDSGLARRMREFRQHGISSDRPPADGAKGWFYEQMELGFNYRLTDFQAALGISQLERLPAFIDRRRAIACCYDAAFAGLAGASPLAVRKGVDHAYHLYVLRLDRERLAADRPTIFRALRAEGLGVQVHYIPVHLHPYYQQNFATRPGLCPIAEAAYEQIVSLPIFPGMTDADVADVIAAVHKVLDHFTKEAQPQGQGL
jgi:perosamine synthetase